MPDYSREAWSRLGRLVRQRRRKLGFDQGDAKDRSNGRIARATWSNIERGVAANYSEDTLDGLCDALGWTAESVDSVLAGGDPTLRTDGDVVATDATFVDKYGRLGDADRRYIEGVIDGLLRDRE